MSQKNSNAFSTKHISSPTSDKCLRQITSKCCRFQTIIAVAVTTQPYHTVDLWCHKFAFLVTFNQEKFIIFVNSIYRIRAGTFLELTSETAIYNNLTAKVSVKCIKWFAICAFLKLTDLMILISIFYNVQDHKLDWETVDTFFNGPSLNYAPLKKRGLVIVEIVWSTWKPILFFHNLCIKSSFLGER